MIRLIPKLIMLVIAFFVISGITAYFTVSYFVKNEETVIVPKLVGKDIIHVLELLTGLGLNVRVKGSAYSKDFAENQIIYQDPDPGEAIKQGRDVRIIISKGTKTLPMPNIKGLNLQQSRLIIDKNGLTQGHISKTFHSGVPNGLIISQYPPPGVTIERGHSTDLLVSRGSRPQEFVMPDLSGLYLDEAVLAAEKNHLIIDSIRTVYDKNKTENSVLGQTPAPGHHYRENQFVNLTVNRKAHYNGKNHDLRQNTTDLFRYRLPPGYLKQHIRLELRAFDTTLILYDELMAPEREIWIAVPAYSVSVIFLYRNDELILSKIYD